MSAVRPQVLALASRWPWPHRHGSDARNAWWVDCLMHGDRYDVALAAAGTDVRVAAAPAGLEVITAPSDPEPGGAAGRWALATVHRTPAWVLAHRSRELGLLVAARQPDVVVAVDDAAEPLLRRVAPGVPVVVDKHAVLTWMAAAAPTTGSPRALYAARHHLLLAQTRAMERRALARADAVTVTTREDAERLSRAHGATATAVVPSGVHLSAMPWRGGGPVGVLGAMTIMPNRTGLERFAREGLGALRRAGLVVEVAGALPDGGLPEIEGSGDVLRLLGFVEDLPGWLCGLSALVVPVWSGSGVKTKTVTAMASGVAVVSTPEGMEGLGAVDGVHYVGAATSEGLVAAATALVADPGRALAVGAAGRRLVAETCSVERCAQTVHGVVDALLERRTP